MNRTILLSFAVLVCMSSIAFADTFAEETANEFTIDFVTISGSTNPISGYGIVNNDYRMGIYEITNDQWNKFTNIYGTPTGSPSNAYDTSAYFTGTNVPTNALSWYEGAQFINWLNTSTGHQAAYKFTGTQGQSDYSLAVWESGDVGYDASNPYRNSGAFYFLPTDNEWAKAAYWNGTSLQTYATKPGDTLYQGNGSNGGWNYLDGDSGPDGPGVGPWDVGSGSEELNGTFDMMGNVWEWMESPYYNGDYLSGSLRGVHSGSFNYYDGILRSSYRGGMNPFDEYDNGIGFRVASVPEPCTILLLGLGALMLRRKL